jgi:hypothetical protein
MRYTGGYLYFDGATGGDLGIKLEGSFLPHGNNDSEENIGDTNYRWHSGWFEDVYTDDLFVDSDGSINAGGKVGNTQTFTCVTRVAQSKSWHDGVAYVDNVEVKKQTLSFAMGILYSDGDESGWSDAE